MKNLKKIVAILLATLMVVGVFAGCSSEPSSSAAAPAGDGAGAAAPVEEEKPFPISIYTMTLQTEVQNEDAEIWNMIEEYTNTDLDITFKPSSGYDENINVLVASNNLPMITTVRDSANKAPVIMQAVDGGAFWEIKQEYIDQFPNISKMNPDVAKNVAFNGKLFSLYRGAELARSGWHFRKDWLENLGLEVPTTIDELRDVIYAFTFDDPDGNGKDDTFGLAMAADVAVKLEFHSMVCTYGGGNEWVEDGNGGLIPTFMTQPYYDTIEFFRDLYSKKALNQDYPTASKNNIYEYWKAGQAGMFFMSLNDANSTNVTDITKTIPGASHDVFSLIESPDGSYHLYPTAGYKNMLMFGTKAIKDEATLLRVMKFCDQMMDKEMQELTSYGKKDAHYKVNDAGKVEITDNDAKSVWTGDFNQLSLEYVDNKTPQQWNELMTKVKQMIADNTPYATPNLVNPFVSDTQSELGGTLDQMIYDARDKYIIGAIDLDGFKAIVEQWRAQGGDKIIAEYSAAYKAANS